MNTLRKSLNISFTAILILISGLTVDFIGVLACMADLSGPKRTERELKDRLDELTRLRRLTIGRELKMIELKKEINELLKGIGYAENYKIH